MSFAQVNQTIQSSMRKSSHLCKECYYVRLPNMDIEPKDVRLPLMVTKSEAEAIDEWRYSNRVPTRAEAIRRLIHVGIAAEPILRDLLRLIEHLNDPELAKHEKAIKEALGE